MIHSNSIKTFALSLLLILSVSAQNSIYVQQIGDSGTTAITQIGSGNNIGGSGWAFSLGDSVNIELQQIGYNNSLEYSFNGGDLTLKSVTVGNSNTQLYNVVGTSNNYRLDFHGDSNDINIKSAEDGPNAATVSNLNMLLNINGNNNAMTFGITDGAHNRLVYGIDGNNNTINSKQTGNPGSGILGSGHEQDVNIFGS